MINIICYLKTYRKRTGISLQDMAAIIGIDSGNLSKIESGKLNPQMNVIIAYNTILKIPIQRLLKNHYPEVNSFSLANARALRTELLEGEVTSSNADRITKLDIIIDRLSELEKIYARE